MIEENKIPSCIVNKVFCSCYLLSKYAKVTINFESFKSVLRFLYSFFK